ncbi:MAG: metallophosphoesterase [Candidatus Kapabacteria bacterium]|jgi:predicted phosphodiesterase|nr:metallophosphoesterase [Candidatus Kapabacteria bacterium]
MKRILTLIIIGAISFATAACTDINVKHPAKFVMKPYLQALTKTGVTVLAETNTQDSVTVVVNNADSEKIAEFYTHHSVETNAKYRSFVHRIKIKGLAAGQTYNYYCVVNKDTSAKAAFGTLVDQGESFKFALMGDCRSNPETHSICADKIASHNPLFSLYGGDLCMSASYNSWKEEFFTDAELNLSASVPFFNTPGNHEGLEINTKAFTQAVSPNSGNPDYYSFDCGNIHYLVLNSECSLGRGSEEYKFIKKDLSETSAQFKIAIFHIPAYCGGGHGESSDMIRITTELLEPADVDLVVSGHSHFYQKNFINGIYHIVIAGGGAPLYTPKDKDYTLKSVKDYHYAIVDSDSTSMTITVYNLEDKVLDVIELQSAEEKILNRIEED